VLALTEDAAAAINRIISSAGLGPEAGLRITSEQVDDGSGASRTDLRLAVVAAPEEGDDVLEGEHVFVDPAASGLLDNRLLDADMVEGEIRFSLDVQA
jgi:iron-sulfur cluster assembly protein